MLISGPILLLNILGPVSNTTLDQLLTPHFLFFCASFLAETPISIVFEQNCKFERNTKQKTLFVSILVLTALVKMSVFLGGGFIFIFSQFPNV